MVLIFNALIISDIEHFFIFLIFISSYSLDVRSLSDRLFANILSHSTGYLFILLMVFFDAQKFKILMKYILPTFNLVACAQTFLRSMLIMHFF